MLTRQGFELFENDPRVRKAKSELCVAPIDRSGIGFPKKFNVWWISKNKIVVPKYWALQTFGACQQDFGMLRKISVDFCGSLRKDLDQFDATEAVMNSLTTTGGAILSLGTGQGKTTCACWVIAQLGVKTVVLVHKEVLKTQWAERIAQFLPSAKISFIQGTTCDTSGDIVIAMIQTLVSPNRTFDFSGVGCVVADECFPYQQLVSTDDGPMFIGDIYKLWTKGGSINVLSYDLNTKMFCMKQVTHAWEKHASELVEIRYTYLFGESRTGMYTATPNHPVLTTMGWKDTGELTKGDLLISFMGTLTVYSITQLHPTHTKVYDIEVEETHTFVCDGGPVAHNCHHISAETFSTAMHGLCCPYTLGLSATPTRKDGLSRVMHWFLGPQAYSTQRREMKNVVVDFLRYTCPRYRLPPPTTRFGTVNFAAVLTDMADDTARTDLIVKRILEIRKDPERIVLVLSHRRDHCVELSKKIPDAVAFLGGVRKRSDDHTTAPVVCATYALASEGYDDSRLNTLVLATPCSDVTQAAGRILRGTSVKNPLIVDVQDDFSVAYAQAAKRKSYYAKAGFTYATAVIKEYPKCIIID